MSSAIRLLVRPLPPLEELMKASDGASKLGVVRMKNKINQMDLLTSLTCISRVLSHSWTLEIDL